MEFRARERQNADHGSLLQRQNLKRSEKQMKLFRYSGIVRLFVCLAVASGWQQGLKAQSVYGSVVGTVTDATGAVIGGAQVTLTNTGTNEHRQTQSDANGNYQFVNLLPGGYSVTV